jgi:hypothetical protein
VDSLYFVTIELLIVKSCIVQTCGLYNKNITIINETSRVIKITIISDATT